MIVVEIVVVDVVVAEIVFVVAAVVEIVGFVVDGFVDGGDANSAGTTNSNGALLISANNGHYFAAADTIDMLIGVSGAVTDTAVIKVWAVVVDCS